MEKSNKIYTGRRGYERKDYESPPFVSANWFFGLPINQAMPLCVSGRNEWGDIIDVPRRPISYAETIDLRLTRAERVGWGKLFNAGYALAHRRDITPREYDEHTEVLSLCGLSGGYITGDAVVYGSKGEKLVVLDAQFLRGINPDSKTNSDHESFVLPKGAWEELKAKADGSVLHLSAEEAEEAQRGQGFIYQSGSFVPANKTAGKVLEHLARGRNLQDYASLLWEVNGRFTPRIGVMGIHFLRYNTHDKPYMMALISNSVTDSDAVSVFGNHASLVGVAPPEYVGKPQEEVLKQIAANVVPEPTLRDRLRSALCGK